MSTPAEETSARASASFDTTVADARRIEREGRWRQARELYQGLLDDASLAAPSRSALLRWIGRTYLEQGDTDTARSSFDHALGVATACGDVGGEAHALNWIAIAEQSVGNLDRSEELYARARVAAARGGDDLLLALIDQNLGTIANIRGELDLALQSYQSSLERCRALALHEYEARVLNNMGLLYTDLGEWNDAERVYAEAYDVCARTADASFLHRIEVNQAELWIARGDLTRATERCEQLIAEHAHTGAPWLGEVYKHYGVACRERAQLERADEHLSRAASIATDTRNLLLAAETAREQAELYWAQSRNADTLQALNTAHRLFSQMRAGRDLAAVARRNERLEARFLDVVRKWGESIESKDCYTQGHCVRVADLACTLAKRAGFDDAT
ncbi:MAG TPA: tetratricopeptide repeat protein, partial [Candidatus Elarobacter sp.]|nr:tetratricopeptide repeat protein [Candidatus Elarobacter sp.]